MSNKTYLMMLGGSLGVTLLAALGATMPSTNAARQATASTATVTVSSTCSMTSNVIEAHTRTMMNGGYEAGIGETRLTAKCNDAYGFSIYAIGYTGGNLGATMLHSDAVGSTYDIQTGVSGSGSEWSMQLTPVTGTYAPYIDNNYDSYSVVPKRYTRVAYLGNSTDATTGGSVTTTYAARISQTQPAGTYVGQVKYILIHPSGTAPSEMPSMQTVARWGGTLLLNEEVTAIDTRDGQTYTVARLCVERDSTTGECTEDQLWMTQNLNFAPLSSRTYNHTDTDLGYTTNDAFAEWTPSADTMANPAWITNFTYTGSANNSVIGWTNDANKPHYAEGRYYETDPGEGEEACPTDQEIVLYQNTKYVGIDDCVDRGHHTVSQCMHYMVGNYYNWPASVASNNANDITARYAVAPNSVCPAGWRLPKGPDGTNGSEFNALLLAAGLTNGTDNGSGSAQNVQWAGGGASAFERAPFYFARSGYVLDSTLYVFTSSALYWSSSTVSSSGAYYLYYYSSVLYPAYQYYRYLGFSLRCVAREQS